MTLFMALRTAWWALRKNTLRSFLATLGIVIAVAAVTGTVSLGRGAQAKVTEQMQSLGANLVMLTQGAPRSHGVSSGAGAGHALTLDDGKAIEHELGTLLKAIAPISRLSAQVVWRDANWSTSITGTTDAYLAVRSWTLSDGEFFGHDEEASAAKVCVLGATVADKLFDGAPALGEQIRVKHLACRVVGIFAKKGQSGWGQDQDDVIVMPFSTVTRRLAPVQFNAGLMFQMSATSPEAAEKLETQVTELLRQRHRIVGDAEDDFSLFNVSEMQEAMKSQTQTLSLLLGSVALISLLVGAIGIANVMLVSVTERTREIGIRMAVGARARDVLVQFLIEALLLSCIGGAIGLGLGAGLAQVMASKGGWPMLVSVPVMAATLSLAAVCGVVAGFYPALRAARLDPIEALRFE